MRFPGIPDLGVCVPAYLVACVAIRNMKAAQSREIPKSIILSSMPISTSSPMCERKSEVHVRSWTLPREIVLPLSVKYLIVREPRVLIFASCSILTDR